MTTQNNDLRESFGRLSYDHHLENFSENLGQYKAKHTCICGFTFITDGHDPLEIGAEARFSFHILDEQMRLFNSEALALLDEISAEIDGQQTYKMFEDSQDILIMKAKAKKIIEAERSRYAG